MRNSVRIGLIGAGFIANLHAKCLSKIPGVEIGAVSDISSSRGRHLARSLAGCEFYPDYNTILKNPKFDAVLVCTPPNSHMVIVMDAIASGKDVFCEKPLCTSLDDAIQIAKAVDASRRRLLVGFMLRYSPIINELKRFCDSHELGNPNRFEASYIIGDPNNDWFWDFHRSGGLITENTIHYLDLVRYLLGEVKRVTSYPANLCHPNVKDFDTVGMMLELESGVTGFVSGGCYSGVIHPSQFFSVNFARGRVAVNGDKLIVEREGNTTTLPFPPDPCYQKQMNEFVACLLTNKPPRVGVQAAVQSLRLALAATRSAVTGTPTMV